MNAKNVLGRLLAAAVLLACGSARAADGVWDNAQGGAWDVDSNWQSGVPAGDGGVASFGAAAGAVTVSNDVPGLALAGLAFNGGAGNGAAWTLNGLPLTLLAPAAVDVAAGSATLELAVGGTAGVVKSGGGAVRFAGGFTGSGGVTLGGGTLQVGSSAELGGGILRIEGGTVAVLDTGVPGLMESSSPNNTITLNTMGTNIGVCLTTRMANNEDSNITSRYPAGTQYIYTGRWHVPADATYSFAKDFDDGGYLAIDGTAILNNSTWSNFVVASNVRLAAGWHDIDIRVANGTGGVGPQTGLPSGIMYDPTNGDFAVGNRENAQIFRDDGSGDTLRSTRVVVMPQRVVLAGDATLDLSAMGADFTPVWTGGCMTDPAVGTPVPVLTIAGGAERLRVAGSGSNHVPFGMEVAAPGGVILEGKVSLLSRPACGLSIADGADIAIAAPGVLGTGDLTLTNHSVRLFSPDALGAAGGDITVLGSGNRVLFECAFINAAGDWQTAGNLVTTFSNNVTLAGTGSFVEFASSGTSFLDAAIGGAGNLTKRGDGRAELLRPCGFTGEVSVAAGRLVVHAPTVGDAGNTVRLSGGVLEFAGSVGAASVALLAGEGGTLHIPAGQTVSVGELRGRLTVAGDGELRTAALAPGVSVTVSGGVRVTVTETAPGTSVTLAGLGSALSLENGARVDTVTVGTNVAGRVEGAGTIGTLAGVGTLEKVGAGTLTVVYASEFQGRIAAAAGTVALDVTQITPAGDPAMWLDASAQGSITYGTKPGSTDPLAVITRWFDRRDNGVFAKIENDNSENYDRPYVMANALNGMDVLSCGGFNEVPNREFRRVVFSSTVNARAVCMVFGSQQGGGHILGQTGNWDFQRNVESNNAKVTSADIAIWKTATFPVWTNGVSVSGQETGLSGGWQVLSVLPNGHGINTLGMANAWQNSGGQRYAEVLIYTNALTDAERRMNEWWLAAKWGLGAFPMPAVSVAAGATLEVNGACQFAALTGAGTVVKTGAGALSFGGAFDGDVRIEGGTFALPSLPPPPEADAVLAGGNPLFWLDACETNRMTFGSYSEQVFQWIDRRPTVNRFAWGYDGGTYHERPWLLAGTAPRGGERFWVDFSTNPVHEATADGKYMKITLDQDPSTYVQDSHIGEIANIRTGFVVLDSLRGGGLPLGNKDNPGNSSFTRDSAGNVASPVWGAGTAAVVTNGETRLDGQRMDGRVTGFNGSVQVLSFTTTGAAKFTNLAATKARYERLGELIFFDTVLSGNARDAIEAYLLNKWTDKTGAGYRLPGERVARHVTVGEGATLDLTGAVGGEIGSVSGAGGVRVPSFAALPLINGGIGALEVTGGDCAFTVAKQGGVDVAQPVVAVTGTLTVPPSGVVSVTFEDKPAPGKITLFTYGALAAPGFGAWTLATGGEVPPGANVRLVSDGQSAWLDITASGTLFLLQ